MKSSFTTATGNRNACIDVYFNVSNDGDIEDLEVRHNGVYVTGLLSEGQIEEIESEAWAHYERECKENNDDLRINQFLAGAA